MLNKIKHKLLYRLLGELCMKSGKCETCPARVGRGETVMYSCAHAYIYDQAIRIWKDGSAVNPIERSNKC